MTSGENPAPAVLAQMLLADGRLPIGGHAHSAGVESAVADGRIGDIDSLTAFVADRQRTGGFVDASFAAATTLRFDGAPPARAALAGVVKPLDVEYEARLVPESLRHASRRLGHRLLRLARRCWPSVVLDTASDANAAGLHFPVALGAAGAAAGIEPGAVALLSLHHCTTTATNAAVRLLGLDPFEAAAIAADLAGNAAAVARRATDAAAGPIEALPCATSTLIDVAAAEHRAWDLRMFAT